MNGWVCVLAAVAWAAGAVGQEANGTRGPVFFAAQGGQRVDVRSAAVLKQRVALDLQDVTIREALTAIATRSGVRFTYAVEDLPSGLKVTLQASSITLAAALTEVLLDADVNVQLAGPAHLALVRRESVAPRALEGALTPVHHSGGIIVGTIIDSITSATVPYVIVRLDEAGVSITANSQGRYAIPDVTPGEHQVSARRVGYLPKTRTVLVEDGKTVTVDFRLNQPPTKLDEVVTTAVGDQRRYQVGNSIATINIDSLAPTAPVTSLTDLISARAPGVEVLEASGLTGAGEAIRIRGLSSLVLQNDPILIVDGVRQDNSAGGDVFALTGGAGHPTPTRLNDLDFSDIESVDILKGPAASTEYGTDAANGVLVIRTKHGVAGGPLWHASAEQTESEMPATFPNNFYSWGHTTDGKDTPVNCPRFTGLSGYSIAAGTCAVDSVTQWNPLNHKATTIFGTGSRGKYDLSVSGGSEAVRYYVSGGLSNESGMVQMPPVFRQFADTAHEGLPAAAYNSSVEQQRSIRANTAIRLGATADLSVNASYLSTYQETPNADALYFGVLTAPGLSDAAHYYGYETFGSASQNYYTPVSELSELGSQNTNRVTGGLTGTWRPTGWFIGHATVGIDHGSQGEQGIIYPLAITGYQNFSALVVGNLTTDIYSVDLRGSATASLGHGLRAVTSAGLQSVDNRTTGQVGSVSGITSTDLSLNGIPNPTVTQQGTRQATLGGYGEEELGIAEQLFLTGAVRVDAASGFGGAYSTAVYPKASLSWLALNRGPVTFRLRGAYGESGVQPMNGASLLLYAQSLAWLQGAPTNVSTLSWPGNPNLRPERSAEFEGGFDLSGWNNRLTFEATAYQKTTHDALVNVNLGETLGSYAYQENIGEVRNTGFEGTLTGAVVQTRSVTLDIAINASVNHNTLVTLAPGVLAQTVYGSLFAYRQAPGYPLYGIWAQNVTYADKNHDGLIERNEITIADSATYQGPSIPTREVSFSTHLGLFGGAVTVGALVDYRGGYKIANETTLYGDYVENTRGANDPHAPLWMQARAAANQGFDFNSLDVEDGSFVRFRELSLTYAAPRGLARLMRVQTVSLTAAVRNLALWTGYSGSDPEVSNNNGTNVQSSPTTNGYTVNNNVRADYGAVPLPRYFVLRLNVGL